MDPFAANPVPSGFMIARYKQIFFIVFCVHVAGVTYFWLRPDEGSPAGEAMPAAEGLQGPGETPTLGGAARREAPVLPFEELEAAANGQAGAGAASISARSLHPLDFSSAQRGELEDLRHADEVKSGILVDADRGLVLWAQNSREPVPIASMTKLMTALLVFEDVEQRDDLDWNTMIPVSKNAYRMGGSQVWLDPRETFSLRELMISIMVKSANDSAYLVGEHVAHGDMDAFIERMNRRAEELRMEDTRFLNAHGLPEKEGSNAASAEDLVYLAAELVKYEKAVEWASIETYDFRAQSGKPTVLTNHNRLVVTEEGVDGLKTGYTKRAGYCLTATCERDGRRLIAVATGFSSGRHRDRYVSDLLDWGFRQISQELAQN